MDSPVGSSPNRGVSGGPDGSRTRRLAPRMALTSSSYWRRDRGHCRYCGAEAATKDHVVPRTHGGGQYRNIVLACWRCNKRKGVKTGFTLIDNVLRYRGIIVGNAGRKQVFGKALWKMVDDWEVANIRRPKVPIQVEVTIALARALRWWPALA